MTHPTPDPLHHRTRNDLLQEMRGIAALLVLMYHAHSMYSAEWLMGIRYNYLNGIWSAGDSGVDFFFALSGFLMVFVHRREEGQPKFRKHFFLKRFLRIYPPYWIAAGIITLFLLIQSWKSGPVYDLSGRRLLATFLLLPRESTLIVPQAWTLTHEVFFYLLFGACFFARRGSLAVIASIWFMAIVATSLIPAAQGTLLGNKWLNIVFSPRNVGFLAGCLAGYLADVVPRRIKVPGFWVGVISFGLIYLLILASEQPIPVTITAYLYALASLLIILGSTAVDIGSRRWLLFLGDASYSIYITHFSLLWFAVRYGLRLRIPERSGYFAAATGYILVTLAVSLAFYYYIERPLIGLNRRLIRQFKRPELEPSRQQTTARS